MNKDLSKLFRVARSRGWTCQRTRHGHIMMRHPNGAVVFTGSTPSDARAIRNAKADIARAERRAGDTA